MAALTIPYIVPLILGMTFDAKSYSPGVSIFNEADITRESHSVKSGTAESLYAIVTENSEIRDALDISGELALKIKTGDIDVKGSGSYLKNDEDLQNSVVILFTFKYKSRVMSLGNAKPKEGWVNVFSKEVLGTHYVDEIVYGVEMIAALRFTATNTSNLREIKAEIEGSFQAGKKQQVDLSVSGQLEKIDKNLKEKAKMEISYFGTLPLTSIPNSIEGVKDLITNFKTHVEKANLQEKGLPMEVHLKELTDWPEARGVKEFQYKVNSATKSRFESFQDGYLRLSEARDKLFSWSRSLPFDLSDASSKKIGRLMTELNKDMNVCYGIISKVDLSAGPETLDGGRYVITKSYMSDVRRLIEEVEQEVSRTAQVSTDTYIHWGSNICPGKETEKLYDGYTIGSTKEGIGGMAKYDCMPLQAAGNANALRDVGHQSVITGIMYGKIDRFATPFKGDVARYASEAAIPCAKCHQKDASTVSVFSAVTKCPASWDLKYTGFLMSGATEDAHTTQYICVDDTPPEYLKTFRVPEKENSIALTLVKSGGSLPKTYINEKIVPCVVCVLKGGRLL